MSDFEGGASFLGLKYQVFVFYPPSIAGYQMHLLVWRVVNKTLKFRVTFLILLTINFLLTATRREKRQAMKLKSGDFYFETFILMNKMGQYLPPRLIKGSIIRGCWFRLFRRPFFCSDLRCFQRPLFVRSMTTLDLTGSKFARSDMSFVKMVLLFSRRSLLLLFDCLMCQKKKTDHTTLNRAS